MKLRAILVAWLVALVPSAARAGYVIENVALPAELRGGIAAIIGTSRSAWPRPISSSRDATHSPSSNRATVQAALDVAREAADRCRHCPKLCTFSCPVGHESAREAHTPWATMTLASRTVAARYGFTTMTLPQRRDGLSWLAM